MSDTPSTPRLRHISARIPAELARQIDLIRDRHRLPHFSDAVTLVVDHGLAALARAPVEEERIANTIIRIEDMAVTALAMLNVAHDLDPEAVAETKAAILEEWTRRGRKRGDAP